MKTNRKIWKRISLVLFLSILTTFGLLISCEKEDIQPNTMQSVKTDESLPAELDALSHVCGEIQRKDLVLENGKKIGNVYVYNDNKYLYVDAYALRRSSLKNAYLFTGLKGAMPLNGDGNPDIHRFNNVIMSEGWVATIRFKILLSDMPTRFVISLMVQSKSNVGRNETDNSIAQKSWAFGKPYGNTEFGRVFGYIKERCSVSGPIDDDLIE